MYSKKINQLATNLNPQSSDLIPIGDATTGQLKTTNFASVFGIPEDGIISGGVVTWSGTGLLFNVSACTYSINGIRYTTPATTVTLTTADPTNPRIDVIAVNTSGAVVLITGTAASNPIEPQVDPLTQIQLTNITVNAGATTPNISNQLIYDENVETWTKAYTELTSINYANTVSPYVGTKSILATTNASGYSTITFTSPSTLSGKNYSVIKFAIKLSRALIGNESIWANIQHSATTYGYKYIFLNGPNNSALSVAGFDYTSTSWQLISVPYESVAIKENDIIGFKFFIFNSSGLTFSIDRVELQNINNQLPTSGISIGDKINNAVNGSVLFAGSGGALSQDNTNFYWDDTNNRLGLGNNTPAYTLDVSGTGRFTGNLTASSFIKSGGTASQILAANGSVITAGTNITISGGTISANDTDTGITSLNGLTALTQTFATGTSGTDFNISSATSTHTFNLPTASATNRGLLSSTDWTTFNNKQDALTNPVTGTGANGQVAYFDGTNSITSSATFAFTPTSQLLLNNSVTASSAIARGARLTPTLTAAANNDVLVGLDVAPTFTNGAFTGVSNIGLRVVTSNTQIAIGHTSSGLSTISNQSNGQLNIAAANSTISFSNNGLFNISNINSAVNATNDLPFRAGSFTFTTSSVDKLKIFNNGNFLLQNGGTFTDAGYKLDVNGTTRLLGNTTFGTIGTNTGMFWDNTNNRLGIGTSSPASILNIQTNENTATNIRLINTATGQGWAYFMIGELAGSGKYGYFGYINASYTASGIFRPNTSFIANANDNGAITVGAFGSNGFIDFATAGTALANIRARITAAGRFLIGTTTESTYLLDVNGTGRFSDNLLVSKNQNAGTTLNLSNTTSGTLSEVSVAATSDASSGVMKIGKHSTGTTPYKILGAKDAYFYNSTTAGDIAILNDFASGAIKFAAGGSSTAHMTITSAGETITGGTTDNGAYNLQCNGTGVWGAGAYVNGSDLRLKENITDLDNCLELVDKMKPVTYNYKESYSKDSSIQTGFIAQDIKELLKDKNYLNGIVKEGPEYLNLAYQNLIPILVKAIQELKSEIETLKNK